MWPLENHWHVPESLEKIITVPRSLHPHLMWWLDENNVIHSQPLHPLKYALQLYTDASNDSTNDFVPSFVVIVQPQANSAGGQVHPRSPECYSRQAVKT